MKPAEFLDGAFGEGGCVGLADLERDCLWRHRLGIELGLTHYIVWFAPVGEHPMRQRALDYDAEAQVGRASIPTSLREFEVQITAENSETPNQPSDLLVASQKIREK